MEKFTPKNENMVTCECVRPSNPERASMLFLSLIQAFSNPSI